MADYTKINSKTIDNWVKSGWMWGIPITHEEYLEAEKGNWDVLLTPSKKVPHEWFGDLKNKSILGLASGGAQQMPIFAALGAKCTVLDYSKEQLKSERMVAEREHYEINIVEADMTNPLPFADESFDIIFHPVSNCYIEDVISVWKECFRILKKGGILLSGTDNGLNYVFNDEETEILYKLPFNPLKDPTLMEELMKNDDGVQFSHTVEEQLDGQIRAGFILTNILGDTNGEGMLHEHNVETMFMTRAIKPERS